MEVTFYRYECVKQKLFWQRKTEETLNSLRSQSVVTSNDRTTFENSHLQIRHRNLQSRRIHFILHIQLEFEKRQKNADFC